jgi:hypothetical protein
LKTSYLVVEEIGQKFVNDGVIRFKDFELVAIDFQAFFFKPEDYFLVVVLGHRGVGYQLSVIAYRMSVVG